MNSAAASIGPVTSLLWEVVLAFRMNDTWRLGVDLAMRGCTNFHAALLIMVEFGVRVTR